MDDQPILDLIRTGRNDLALNALYRNFPAIRRLVRSRGGNTKDAEDIFQEALLILLKKIAQPEFQLTAKLSTYPGLSTLAGDRLLETGGMFFVDARQNGKPLRIDPAHASYAEIPTGNVRSGMQLFTGKRLAGGIIDWTNPRPLEHDLLPVDIHLLDFYPPHFLDSVAAWGYDRGNKTFTDRLYYAFSYLFDGSDPARNAVFSRLSSAIKVAPAQSNTFGAPLRDSIGPWLAPARRSFLQNVISLIYRTHPRINLRSRQSSPGSNTTAGQSTAFTSPVIADTSRPTITDSSRVRHTRPDTAAPSWCTINPAKIAAIWNDHFQNTLLATREFEQRLILIHQTGDNNLLDLYVDHLDLGLSTIDSIAATQTTGWAQRQFLTFAARNDGKVRHGDTRFDKLREYYQIIDQRQQEDQSRHHREYFTVFYICRGVGIVVQMHERPQRIAQCTELCVAVF